MIKEEINKMEFKIIALVDNENQAKELGYIKYITLVGYRARILGKTARKTKDVHKHECNKKDNDNGK